MEKEGIYNCWASAYESFEAEVSIDTWRSGILKELSAYNCTDPIILDIGAGTGIGRRLILDMMPQATVFCLDRSPRMLEVGAVPPEYAIVADMAAFEPTENAYDFVVCGFDALNYLHRYDLLRCLTWVARALKPGGQMIFDYSSQRLLREDWGHLDVTRMAGSGELSSSHRYDPLVDRTTVSLSLAEGGVERWREVHRHYGVDVSEMDRLVRLAGLCVRSVRDVTGDRFLPGSVSHLWTLGHAQA